jgi:hypothetical protein
MNLKKTLLKSLLTDEDVFQYRKIEINLIKEINSQLNKIFRMDFLKSKRIRRALIKINKIHNF